MRLCSEEGLYLGIFLDENTKLRIPGGVLHTSSRISIPLWICVCINHRTWITEVYFYRKIGTTVGECDCSQILPEQNRPRLLFVANALHHVVSSSLVPVFAVLSSRLGDCWNWKFFRATFFRVLSEKIRVARLWLFPSILIGIARPTSL